MADDLRLRPDAEAGVAGDEEKLLVENVERELKVAELDSDGLGDHPR